MKCKILPPVLQLVILLVLTLCFPVTTYAQSGGLGSVTDITNTTTYGAEASHSISFILPLTAEPIYTTDWIIIALDGYPVVSSGPTSVRGTLGGLPEFSLSGKRGKISKVTVAPGSMITIDGITATNPDRYSAYVVAVVVAEDEEGTLIKNIGQTYPTVIPGQVTVSASIDTPQSRLAINGFGSPESFVTFSENGAVAGTVVGSLSGYFAHVFSGITPGDHQYTLYGVDKNNLTTSPITVNVYTPEFQETTVSNQILSPTIKINKYSYTLGESVIATGSAVPNSAITLFTEAPLRAYATTTDNDGDWTYTISDTSSYYAGDYHIHAIVQTDSGLTSINSPSLGFSFLPSTTPTGTACGDISKGDLNCDTNVDLTDFSILMFYWGTSNASADVNSDRLVDLTDFSVVMYWWGS